MRNFRSLLKLNCLNSQKKVNMEQDIITERYVVLYFFLVLLTACGGGENGFIFESEKRGDGIIEIVNPEGSTAHRLHLRDFETEEDWVEATCSVYEHENLPLPGGNLNTNFLLEENSAWSCVRRTESFRIETEILFHDDGTYRNRLTRWEISLADAAVFTPPEQECHRRGMPYNSTWETEEFGFAFDRRGQWSGEWRVYGGRLYLKEKGLPGRFKSYAFSFNGQEPALTLDDMVEIYSDGSAINYQEDLEPSELDSEEIRQEREKQRRAYEQTEEFRNCQKNSEFGGCWTNPQLWKSELRDTGTECRAAGRSDID